MLSQKRLKDKTNGLSEKKVNYYDQAPYVPLLQNT